MNKKFVIGLSLFLVGVCVVSGKMALDHASAASGINGSGQLSSQKVFHVKDYGAFPDDDQDDRAGIEAAMNAAVAAGAGSKVIFEKGVYRITPAASSGIGTWVYRYVGADGLELKGNQTTLLFTDPFVSGFSFVGSKNVQMDGFTLDYETPPFTQGEITHVDEANRTVTYVVDEGYPLFDDERLKDPRLNVYGWVTDENDPTSVKKTLRQTNLRLESWEKTGERTYQLLMRAFVKNQNLMGHAAKWKSATHSSSACATSQNR